MDGWIKILYLTQIKNIVFIKLKLVLIIEIYLQRIVLTLIQSQFGFI